MAWTRGVTLRREPPLYRMARSCGSCTAHPGRCGPGSMAEWKCLTRTRLMPRTSRLTLSHYHTTIGESSGSAPTARSGEGKGTGHRGCNWLPSWVTDLLEQV